MIFIASADGSIQKVLPSTVNQGSNEASRIILIGPFLTSNRVKCAFRLPNGMVSGYEEVNPIEMTQLDLSDTELGKNYTAWYYNLQDFVTAIKGTVSVQFTIYNGTQKITTTAQDFQVLRGVENLEPDITTDEYTQIENALSGINADIETINLAIDELKTKTSILITDGSGNNYLADNGKYKPINIPTVDSELSLTSANAVENKVVTENLNKKLESKDIATINGQSITAGGNITIEGGSGETVTVDSELSTTSENPVQNKVITEALDNKVGFEDYATANKGGVIKLDDYNGLRFTGTKRLALQPATPSSIAQRGGVGSSSGYGAITPNNVNEGVKAALTDAKKMVLTTDEQASARETIGATKLYKHTIAVTLNGNSTPDFNIEFYSVKANTDSVLQSFETTLIDINVDGIITTPYVSLNGVFACIFTVDGNSNPIYQLDLSNMALGNITSVSTVETYVGV